MSADKKTSGAGRYDAHPDWKAREEEAKAARHASVAAKALVAVTERHPENKDATEKLRAALAVLIEFELASQNRLESVFTSNSANIKINDRVCITPSYV
jgi:hypothetical protein